MRKRGEREGVSTHPQNSDHPAWTLAGAGRAPTIRLQSGGSGSPAPTAWRPPEAGHRAVLSTVLSFAVTGTRSCALQS